MKLDNIQNQHSVQLRAAKEFPTAIVFEAFCRFAQDHILKKLMAIADIVKIQQSNRLKVKEIETLGVISTIEPHSPALPYTQRVMKKRGQVIIASHLFNSNRT